MSSQRSSSSANCTCGTSSILRPSPKIRGSFAGSLAQRVIENLDVIDLFSRRDLALFRMAGVIETGIVFLPCDAGEARALNGIRQHLPARRLYHAQCTLF